MHVVHQFARHARVVGPEIQRAHTRHRGKWFPVHLFVQDAKAMKRSLASEPVNERVIEAVNRACAGITSEGCGDQTLDSLTLDLHEQLGASAHEVADLGEGRDLTRLARLAEQESVAQRANGGGVRQRGIVMDDDDAIAVAWTSSSMPSASASRASAKLARVFSRARRGMPRCAMRRGGRGGVGMAGETVSARACKLSGGITFENRP